MVRLVAVKGLLEPKNTKIKQRKTISSKPSPRQLALSVAQSYGGKRFSNKIFFQIIVSDIFSPHVFGYDETPLVIMKTILLRQYVSTPCHRKPHSPPSIWLR